MAEIPIELAGFDVFKSKLDAAGKAIENTSKASKELGQSFQKALAGEVIASSLGKMAEAFEGTTAAGLKTAADLTRAYLQGGPLGLAIAGIGTIVSEAAKTWQAYEDQAAHAALATIEALNQSSRALSDHTDRIRKAAEEIRGIRLAREDAVGIEEALALITRERAEEAVRAHEQTVSAAERNIARVDEALKKLEADPTRRAELERESLNRQRELFDNSRRVAEAGVREANANISALDEEFRRDEEKRIVEDDKRRAEERRRERLAELKRQTEEEWREVHRRFEESIRIEEQKRKEGAERMTALAQARIDAENAAIARQLDDRRALFAAEAEMEAQRAEWDAAKAAAAEGVLADAVSIFANWDAQTKAALESRAKQAGIEALFEGAKAIQQFAEYAASGFLDPTSFASMNAHALAAAKFAAVAGVSAGAAALGNFGGGSGGDRDRREIGGNSTTPMTVAETDAGGRTRFSDQGGRSRGGVVINNYGSVLMTRAEQGRAVRRALAEYERTR